MAEIHDFETDMRRAEEALARATISEENKKLIRRFVVEKTANQVKKPRLIKYLLVLRLLAERYLDGRNYAELRSEDLVAIVASIELSDKSAWTKTDYKKVLKTFYRWQGKPELLDWLKVRPPESALQPEDLLDASDVQQMIDHACNDRDRAFIAAIYDGAFRIGEIGGAAIKNVVFERYCARLSVSGKTGRRTVTLIYARPYLARWLEVHPYKDEPDAPLWIDLLKLPTKVALDYYALRAILIRTAEKAEIKKKAGNPHLYRHSRATPLALELPGPVFEQFMGWSPGSRMVQRYVHLADRAADPFLFRAAGVEVPADQRKKAQVLQCPFCRAPNSLSARVCSKCLMPLREEEIRTREEKMMGLATAIVGLLSEHPGSADIFQRYLKELK